jgi:hypothetical protein
VKDAKKRLAIIALAAVIGFSFSACGGGDGGGGGGGGINTAALDAVIGEAWNTREGVEVASDASEVPTGRSWVTQSEFNAFDEALRAAAEVSANPSSQSDVDTAKTDLQAAIAAFNTAKKDGSGAAITLSGTITVKNNGRAVPYVKIIARTEDWQWQKSVGIPSAEPDSPWEIIIKPFEDYPRDIVFIIEGYSSNKYDNRLFATDVYGLKKTVHDENVEGIAINLGDLKLITISGTFTLDLNGKKIPSVEIAVNRKDDRLRLGFATILNAGNNTPWSMTIPAQDVDTDITFQIVGFDGPIPWGYDQLFAFWEGDFGVKIKNQNKPGIALKFITISGTVNIPSVPVVDIQISKRVSDDDYPWIAGINLYNPPANAPWGPLVIQAFTSDTELHVGVNGYDDEGEWMFWVGEIVKTTAKDKNISGIEVNLNLNLISISGTISVTYDGNPVPNVWIYSTKVSDGYYLGSTSLISPPEDSPWRMWIPAFTSDTEININVVVYDDEDEDWEFRWDDGLLKTITVKNTNVTGIELDLGDITD